MTYPNDEVARFLTENTVPFKPELSEHRDLARTYGVQWTPGLAWLDAKGHACHQNVGYFAPEEFVAESRFGLGRVAMRSKAWDDAIAHFDRVVSDSKGSAAAPAALYWSAVCEKLRSGEVDLLLEKWNRLLDEYPKHPWAAKAAFIRD